MASPKEQVLDMVRALPDDATIGDIMAELYFRIQVDSGLRQLDAGEGIPHDHVERRLAKWLER